MHVEAPVRHAGPIQGPDYDFLAGVVAKTPKVFIPAPSMLHFRGGRQALSRKVYPDLEAFYADLAAASSAAIAELSTRCSRYLQMADPTLAYLSAPPPHCPPPPPAHAPAAPHPPPSPR